MFEGSLDEWSQKLKDGTQQQIEEFQHEMELESEVTLETEVEIDYKNQLHQINDVETQAHLNEKI